MLGFGRPWGSRAVRLVALASVAVPLGLLVVGGVVVGNGSRGGAEPIAGASDTTDVAHIYLRDCATCHGADARGTSVAPTLRGVGTAAIDFWVSTGRMPLPVSSPQLQTPSPSTAIQRHTPKYPRPVIDALVQYVATLAGGGGPSIPTLDLANGSLSLGQQLYALNCAACHQWSGAGGALLGREAPSVHPATPTQVAEAVRTGPATMPAFGTAALDKHQLQSVVEYVGYLDHPQDRGGNPLWHLGPVAEGAIGWIVGMGLLVGALRLIGTKT